MSEILDSHYAPSQAEQTESLKKFFSGVYTYMCLALGVSGLLAYYLAESGTILNIIMNVDGTLSPVFYIISFAPLGLGLLIQTMYRKFSMPVLIVMFLAYSVLMGMSLSTIFLVYDLKNIAITFFITAGGFGGMAILGFTTKVDLTKMGSLLYMVFIGMFIAGIANFWIGSDALDYVLSLLGVVVFTGLIAYYMQTLKNVALDPTMGEQDKQKLTLIGGLILYILFINLFMSLLRLLGND